VLISVDLSFCMHARHADGHANASIKIGDTI